MKTPLVTVEPDRKTRLKNIDSSANGGWENREAVQPRLQELGQQIQQLQEKLYAENRRSLLLIFQAMDTGGKDGAVKKLLTGVNPAGVQVTSFKAPSTEELQHDFLWRVHEKVPPRGIIGVWNRSHYEDVLIVRVHELVEKKVWKQRYGHINDFEKTLAQNGVTILKFFLHISKDEQKARLQARLGDPAKCWKFNPADLKERALWDDYQRAYEDALNECSTKHAPWHIVPADEKWVRDLCVAQTVFAALEAMNPKFPKPGFDPVKISIE